jgi:hypothetical protein
MPGLLSRHKLTRSSNINDTSDLELWGLAPLSTIIQLYHDGLLVEETRVLRENHRPATSH